MKPETVTFTKVVELVDADNMPIQVGSVLREINDGEQGVVVAIMRIGDVGSPFDQVGDLKIHMGQGCTRVTNRYDQWRHVPHNEQTYEQRFISWLNIPYDYTDAYPSVSADEAKAIDGILSILPDDTIDWNFGPYPHTVEDALHFLVRHLSSLGR